MIDERERQAYFAQSARTTGGKRAEYDPEDVECDHDWRYVNDSFDHHFGTERIKPYLECNCCLETKDIEADY
jgi:hypothetical protein